MINFGNYVKDNISKENRWQLLTKFLQNWQLPFAKISPYLQEDIAHAEHRLKIKLPSALHEWYLLSYQPHHLLHDPVTWNYVVPPSELKLKGRYLPVFVEGQGCFEWAISTSNLEKDDPPVYMRTLPYIEYIGDSMQYMKAGTWHLENEAFSEFVAQMIVLETINVQGFNANGISNLSVLERVEKNFEKLGFPDWHYPANSTSFYGSKDTILIALTGQDVEIILGALSRHALEKAIFILGDIQWRWMNTTGEFQRHHEFDR